MHCTGSGKRSGLMTRFGRMAVAQAMLMAAVMGAAGADSQPLEILRRSILARASVDFSGIRTVVVFAEGRKLHGVEQKIDCDAPANLRIVVLAPESQRGKLCLTTGRDHWEYTPATGRVVHAQLPPPDQVITTRLRELESLAARMRMQYVGVESMAGRTSHVVKVYTTRGVPVKKAWVDAQHYVELKTQRFDSHGRVKSSAYYTRIDFNPTFAPGLFEFEPPAGASVIEARRPSERLGLEEAEQRAGFAAVLPGYLPPGYEFESDRTTVIEVNGKPTIWLPFSNGADTFSLFERRAVGDCVAVEHGPSITWQEGGYCFTLMGTLSAGEALKVRASVRP